MDGSHSPLQRWAEVGPIVDGALGLPAVDRERYVHECSGGDGELEALALAFLDRCDEVGDFLEEPAAAQAAEALSGLAEALAVDRVPDLGGRRVGAYRLVEQIGRGGMGVVYRAERADDDFEQRVAVKLLPAGMASRRAIRRFRTERRILAQLEHPNIARLLDGGITDEGLPYLVMEYVAGTPIDTWCEQRELSLAARLELFLAVCDGVDHAHRQLVVHRDLKPSNLLVTDDGVPKLLDFGIARLLEEEDAALTATRFRPLTPAYASPEQIRGDPVGTAGDVFTLGILLYLLLTGAHPFRDGDASPEETARAVLEREPMRPSLRIAASEPGASGRRLRGDLDTIVLTALRKDPADRYPSVARFAEDLRRHRDGLPIRARPATLRYRAGRFLARHAVAATAAALVLLTLVTGLATTAWQAREARRERDAARREALRAERTADFLAGLFEGADPNRTGGRTLTAQELLARGAATLDVGLGDEPAVRAELLRTIGVAEGQLGELAAAEAHLREVVAELRHDSPEGSAELALALADLGDVLLERGSYEPARDAFAESLALRAALFGRDSLEYAASLHGLGTVATKTGDFEPASEAFAESLDVRRQQLEPPHPDLAASLQAYANTLVEPDDRESAIALLEESVAMWRELGDENLFERARAENDLGILLHSIGRLEETEALYRSSLAAVERLYGPDHPAVGDHLTNLGKVRIDRGHFREAEPVARRAVAIARAHREPTHFDRIGAEINLGTVLVELGDFEAGAEVYAEALAGFEEVLGPDHPFTGFVLAYLGRARLLGGDPARAEGAFDRAIAILANSPFAEDGRTQRALQGRACLWREEGRLEESRTLLEEVLAAYRRGPRSWYTAEAEVELAETLRRLGERARAATLLRDALATLESSRGADDWLTRRAASSLAELG